MAETPLSVPSLSAEQRRIADQRFERANQVLAGGNYEYGLQLLLSCCTLDPANLGYRQHLHDVRRRNAGREPGAATGSLLATSPEWGRLRGLKAAGDHLGVLEQGEKILCRTPGDVSLHVELAEAAHALRLTDLTLWLLGTARTLDPDNVPVNRQLARLLEIQGDFPGAYYVWRHLRAVVSVDKEAATRIRALQDRPDVRASEASGLPPSLPGAAQPGTAPSAEPAETPTAEEAAEQAAAAARAELDADPARVEPYLVLGRAHRRRGESAEARTVLRRGLTATGKSMHLLLELADLDLDAQRVELHAVEARLGDNPDDEADQARRAELRRHIDRREAQIFRRKAGLAPDDLRHRLELGIRLMRLDRLDDAIAELQAARPDPRLRWKALFYLGLSFKKRHNWRLAERHFEEALAALPADETTAGESARKELLFQLAAGAANADDLGRAIQFGSELVRLDASYRGIGELLHSWQAHGRAG